MLLNRTLIFRRAYTSLPMPALSPTMITGRISSWKKKDGETFKVDDVLCEVETDKAVVDFSAVEEGVIAKILVQAGGEPVPVGATLAIVVEDAAEISKAIEEYEKNKGKAPSAASANSAGSSASAAKPTSATAKSDRSKTSDSTTSKPAPTKGSGKEVPVSPSARSILGENIDFSQIIGTGKNGRIMKEDAISFVSSKKKQLDTAKNTGAVSFSSIPTMKPRSLPREPAQSHWLPEDRGAFRDVPLTTMRRVIAQRLSESKENVPHAYATIDADIDSALEARNHLKKLGMPTPSMNDLVIRACALALRKVPSLNVRIENGSIKPNDKVDISVAVATPGGLITPIIEAADRKNPMEISVKIKDLAGRAKENKLKPAEFQGGSFTVSNLGMFGVDDFTAIINPPQVAILAIGSGKKCLSVPSSTKKSEISLSAVESRTRMTVALSFDPRAVNPVNASKFLQSFQSFMESPAALFTTSPSS
jgi:pyruvate dehydrogenase E2 component (dihydrolipoamide acetyltransferase)